MDATRLIEEVRDLETAGLALKRESALANALEAALALLNSPKVALEFCDETQKLVSERDRALAENARLRHSLIEATHCQGCPTVSQCAQEGACAKGHDLAERVRQRYEQEASLRERLTGLRMRISILRVIMRNFSPAQPGEAVDEVMAAIGAAVGQVPTDPLQEARDAIRQALDQADRLRRVDDITYPLRAALQELDAKNERGAADLVERAVAAALDTDLMREHVAGNPTEDWTKGAAMWRQTPLCRALFAAREQVCALVQQAQTTTPKSTTKEA